MKSTISSFDVFRSFDGHVSKYIHEDGSETSIKKVKSLQNIVNPLTKKIETLASDRNKYSIFISSSVGCYMSCKFCHLTLKKAEYHKITSETVLSNLKEAILDAVAFDPSLKNRYVKLSWMGMGDAINNPEMVAFVTRSILDWIFEHNLAKGLDGVDLSTVMPKIKNMDWIPIFHQLESDLHQYPINPVYTMDNVQFSTGYYSHKNIFRLFYSIESAIQSRRDYVIPNAMPLEQAHQHFHQYSMNGQYTLILHHLLVEGLNDSQDELLALVDLCLNHYPNHELRILRYNYCANSTYQESQTFIDQIQYLSQHLPFIKVQISPGTEVSAACGQFIVKDFIRISNQT